MGARRIFGQGPNTMEKKNSGNSSVCATRVFAAVFSVSVKAALFWMGPTSHGAAIQVCVAFQFSQTSVSPPLSLL